MRFTPFLCSTKCITVMHVPGPFGLVILKCIKLRLAVPCSTVHACHPYGDSPSSWISKGELYSSTALHANIDICGLLQKSSISTDFCEAAFKSSYIEMYRHWLAA